MTARNWRAAALVLATAGAWSCHTTQPTQAPAQTITVTVDALALNSKWNCWDVSDGSILCQEDLLNNLPQLVTRPTAWGYSVEVAVIKSGQTSETLVASSVTPTDVPPAFPVFGNMTDFDPAEETAPTCPTPPVTYPCSEYSNPRKVTQGSRSYAEYAHLPLPEPNILNRTGSYSFTANKGDTILVRARKALLSDYPQTVQRYQDPEIVLEAGIAVDGRSAVPLGTSSSNFEDGSGVAFSYTIR